MTDASSIQGELQGQIMAVLWRIEEGSVEQVRQALPGRYRGAYTTVQTVLNRLSDRGLLARRRKGNVIIYRPRLSEAEYLSRSIQSTLSGATPEARQLALAQLIGGLQGNELSDLRRLAGRITTKRKAR